MNYFIILEGETRRHITGTIVSISDSGAFSGMSAGSDHPDAARNIPGRVGGGYGEFRNFLARGDREGIFL
jgi:hypothetical protein